MRNAVAVVTALLVAVPAAAADEGAVIYGKGQALYRLPMAGGGAATEIVKLGFDAADVTRLAAGPRGRSLLISTGAVHYWTRIRGDAPAEVVEVCRGRATLSGDGRCVLCQGEGKLAISRLYPRRITRPIPIRGKLATLLGDRVSHVVAVTDRGVEAFTISKPRVRTLLARQKPAEDLLISPDGKRAVISVAEDDGGDKTHSVYQFLLDGKGVMRKLVVDNRPVRWTRDSTWVIAAGPDNTCIARARGGHYRCWTGWRALDMRPDGVEALVVKGNPGRLELARVSLGGARSATPKTFLRGAAGDALWVP